MSTLTTPVAIPQGKELEMEDQEFELDIRVSTFTTSLPTNAYTPAGCPGPTVSCNGTCAGTCTCYSDCGTCATNCGTCGNSCGCSRASHEYVCCA